MVRLLTVMVALALTMGCLGPSPTHTVVSRLYFGMNRDGGPITDASFIQFVDEEVTPRFPDGLTIYDGRGQWRGQNKKVIRESSRIIEIIHVDDVATRDAIETIRRSYKKRFAQESVLLIRSHPSVASF